NDTRQYNAFYQPFCLLRRKIQKIKSVGKGYRTFKNFRSVILFFNGGLNLYTLKSRVEYYFLMRLA
ncbi:MAG: hypothetical protein ACWIPJ_07015, partial [Polaribacter sp.]